jgi:RNA polymerase sigma-70 factor (ECF subfamily)
MNGSDKGDPPEARFKRLFDHFGLVSAYARRRGCLDGEEIAAEVMAIAWRRLADVPEDDPRGWLLGVARNLAYADWRGRRASGRLQDGPELGVDEEPSMLSSEVDPGLSAVLLSLSLPEREALLLVAWEDLTPAQAAVSLGISATAFRARLHRARRRCRAALDRAELAAPAAHEPALRQCCTSPLEEA